MQQQPPAEDLPAPGGEDAPASQDPALLRRLLRAKDRMDAASQEAWPPHRYLLTRRIERATALLRDTDWPVTEIAFHTGCSDWAWSSRRNQRTATAPRTPASATRRATAGR